MSAAQFNKGKPMSGHERALELLDDHEGDVAAACREIADNMSDLDYRDLAIYLFKVAFERVKARKRHAMRKRIKTTEVNMRPTDKPFPINLERSRKAIRERTLDLLATWMVGDIQLG